MKTALTLICLIFLASCGSSDAPITGQADIYLPPQVQLSDPALQHAVVFGQLTKSYDQSHILHVDVPIRATTDNPMTLDYRFTWFNAMHQPIETPTSWQTVNLTPKVLQHIQANSATTQATDFQFDVRPAQ